MLRRYLSKKTNIIEGLVITLSLIWFLVNNKADQLVTSEFIINLTFLILLTVLMISRSSSIRHMYFGFVLLVLVIVVSIFGYDQFVYFISSLALSLFTLGIINMLFFKSND